MLWSPRSMQKEEDVVIGADIADTEVEVVASSSASNEQRTRRGHHPPYVVRGLYRCTSKHYYSFPLTRKLVAASERFIQKPQTRVYECLEGGNGREVHLVFRLSWVVRSSTNCLINGAGADVVSYVVRGISSLFIPCF